MRSKSGAKEIVRMKYIIPLAAGLPEMPLVPVRLSERAKNFSCTMFAV